MSMPFMPADANDNLAKIIINSGMAEVIPRSVHLLAYAIASIVSMNAKSETSDNRTFQVTFFRSLLWLCPEVIPMIKCDIRKNDGTNSTNGQKAILAYLSIADGIEVYSTTADEDKVLLGNAALSTLAASAAALVQSECNLSRKLRMNDSIKKNANNPKGIATTNAKLAAAMTTKTSTTVGWDVPAVFPGLSLTAAEFLPLLSGTAFSASLFS